MNQDCLFSRTHNVTTQSALQGQERHYEEEGIGDIKDQ